LPLGLLSSHFYHASRSKFCMHLSCLLRASLFSFIPKLSGKIMLSFDQSFWVNLIESTKKMRPCSRIYYSNVSKLFNMFRATHRSSSGAQKL
jgi:hypothetical protein